MVEPLRHRQTKEAATDMFSLKATASHSDSTIRYRSAAMGMSVSASSGNAPKSQNGVMGQFRTCAPRKNREDLIATMLAVERAEIPTPRGCGVSVPGTVSQLLARL